MDNYLDIRDIQPWTDKGSSLPTGAYDRQFFILEQGKDTSLHVYDEGDWYRVVGLNRKTEEDANYITSAGDLIIQPDGDIILDPGGDDVYPQDNYDVNLGLTDKKFLSFHAAELNVSNIVAQNVLATLGGRIVIAPANVLISDLSTSATTIRVKYNNLANGDRIYMEANSNVEFMAVTSAASAITGGFSYTVTRNLDASGANEWSAGDGIINTGSAGDQFIDIYSVSGIDASAQAGAAIVGNVRDSATYNDWSERWAVGNMKNLYGYGSNTYGAAFGEYAASKANITIDDTNGIRLRQHTTTLGQWKNDGTIVVGEDANSKSRVEIASGAISMISKSGGGADSTKLALTAAGDLSLTGSITITGGSGIANLTDAGALATGDDLDDVPNGSSYGRILLTDISAGHILLSETIGDIDDISDGTTYGRVKTTDLSAGHIILSTTIGDLDDISNGSTYGRIAVTDISSGHIILSTTVGDLDDVSDGSTYGKLRLTDMSAGRILIKGSDGLTTVITGGQISANSLKAGDIAANAITASELNVVGIDGSGRIVVADATDANEVTSGINSHATTEITAGKIVISGSTNLDDWRHGSDLTKIDGGDIYANSVTASQIAAGTITATELAANSVNTSEIAANAVTATEINVATLDAIAVSAGTITSGSYYGGLFSTENLPYSGAYLEIDNHVITFGTTGIGTSSLSQISILGDTDIAISGDYFNASYYMANSSAGSNDQVLISDGTNGARFGTCSSSSMDSSLPDMTSETLVTDLRWSGSTLQWKYRTVTVTNGIFTSIGAETSWAAVPTV